jgi:antitoxin component YwqK of YwqJK toxin-antitoxin module
VKRSAALLLLLLACGQSAPEGARREVVQHWPARGSRAPIVRVRGREVVKAGDWVKEGQFVFYDRDGREVGRGGYSDGLEHGPWVQTEESSHVAKGSFRMGRREGPWAYTFSSGQQQEEGTYVSGQRTGLWQRWYEDGTLAEECTYREGKRHGECRFFGPQGSQDELLSGRYKMGERVK